MKRFITLILVLLLASCGGDVSKEATEQSRETSKTTDITKTIAKDAKQTTTKSEEESQKIKTDLSAYKGSGHICAGNIEILEENIYEGGDRIASLAKAICEDGKEFLLPADIAYNIEDIPFARDLYNPDGTMYEKSEIASVSYENKDAFVIDEDGDVFTAYVFANNYFDIYINGVLVAKDKIPYIPYNSSVIKFKVKRPFYVAFHVVDWEEDMGFGLEANRGKKHTPSEGGIAFTFKKGLYDIVNISDASYRVQTFYTSPIQDFSLFKEEGELRDSSAIKLDDLADEKAGYGIFWDMDENVFSPSFDDSHWQQATEYRAEDLNVDELPAYKNFRDIFDSSSLDAQFIWTNSLYLDNDVVIRGIVE